jgi:hypothetical protein
MGAQGGQSEPYDRGREAGRARGTELGFEAGYRAAEELSHVDMRQPEEIGDRRASHEYANGFRDGCLATLVAAFRAGWDDGYRHLLRENAETE